MDRPRFAALALSAVSFFGVPAAFASPPVAPTDALSPEQERARFKLPPGFEIQLVAADPDIYKPMNIAFDAAGRLWVTDTIEYPWPVKEGQIGRDTVKILEDFGEDGRARKISTFADGLNIPLGVLPLNVADGKTSALVYGIPEIRRMTDTDGDGKADQREAILGSFASKDTHGMTNNFVRGFDGWVYANHGFSNNSIVTAKDGSSIEMNSGNTYRFKLDGSHVEYHAHGQVNPFGLCFDPLGNLYSADCHSRPQYLLLRGAYYPSFGKPHDGLGYGPEMCYHDHGSTAIAGTLFYAAEQFPPEFRGNLFNGNPVTNAVNRDRVEWTGSSPKAIEAPDLVASDDPWFRPVQVTQGPDGAVYIADFYNKIIGHYEVDLKHPGRDRTKGRIWRVVYKGDKATPAPKPMPNLAKMSPAELVQALGDANLAVRLAATNRIVDVAAKESAEALKAAIEKPANADQKAHALWAMQRTSALAPAELVKAATDAERVVRVHAFRIMAERGDWSDALNAAAIAGLADADPFVQRAAAEALGRRPSLENVKPLVTAQARAAKEDYHLIHVLRMAVRDQFQPPSDLATLPRPDWGDAEKAAALQSLASVPSPAAGAFLLNHLRTAKIDPKTAEAQLRHAARFAPEREADLLPGIVEKAFAGEVDLQLELYKSVSEGLKQRGAQPGPAVRAWGTKLATETLTPTQRPSPRDKWTAGPIEGSKFNGEPWPVKALPSADGKNSEPFFWSLGKGEPYVGRLRSEAFDVPESLSFYVAGQSGEPPTSGAIRSAVRLCSEPDGEVLAEAPVPRNDVAQRVTWDLKKFAGRRAYLEARDNDDRKAWAWVAVGRIAPPVATVPMGKSETLKKRQLAAVEIAGALKLAACQGPVQALLTGDAESTVRVAAARALAAIDPAAAAPLAAVVAETSTPASVREAAAAALGGASSEATRSALIAALATAPQAGQKAIALALASSPAGAEALLVAVSQGKASPRLLQEKAVRDRLNSSKPDKLEERVATLTKGLVGVEVAVQKMIDQRVKAFDPAKASADRGLAVFQRNCAACHRVGNEGAQVGPQLDGAGKRGHERIFEDILDPSRNVDTAFRVSILTLADGDVTTGLFRREEGETAVFADATGKEFAVAKAQLSKKRESQLSLMPANFGETLKPEELNDLAAFLLSK